PRLSKVVDDIRLIQPDCYGVCGDVTDERTVIEFFQKVPQRWGKLDILVNSAGRDSLAPPVSEVTLEEWNKTIAVNLTGVFLCCREAFRIMEKQSGGGRIINLGSTSAKLASSPGHSPYRASKHGMMGFSENILLEGVQKNIAVTVINPSHVKTPMTEVIDKGIYAEGLPAYLEGWLDPKEAEEGIYASCIDVQYVAEIILYIATLPPEVTIPQFSVYPTHKAHRYGMRA
ncbi:MAG: SDR family oxidoreductase, partial [Atribacterota bacterium]|nr:SDR family oxidoreductase [Atribacterota bacterium]